MRKLGLIGGISWAATERYYRIINERVVTLCRAVCTQVAIETVDEAR